MFDPFGLLSEYQLPSSGYSAGMRSPIQPFKTPEDEQGVLSKLAETSLGGMGYIGSTIDKLTGRRAIGTALKGLTGGDIHPSELLSFLPGSDVLGITDSHNAVSGDELAKHWGLIGEGTKGQFEAQDLVGPALEIATDPSTYYTFGASALSKAGKIGKKIGINMGDAAARKATLGSALKTPELRQLAETAFGGPLTPAIENMRMGGDFAVGLPFFDKKIVDAPNWMAKTPFPGVNMAMAAAPYAAKIVGLEKPYNAISNAADWTGRQLGGLFDYSRKGETEPPFIKAAQYATKRSEELLPQLREKVYGAASDLEHAGAYTPDDLARVIYERERPLLNSQLQGPPTPQQAALLQRFPQNVGSLPDLPGMQAPLTAPQQQLLGHIGDVLDTPLDQFGRRQSQLEALGIKQPEIQGYFPHTWTPLKNEASGGGRGKNFNVFDPSAMAREEPFAGLPRAHQEAIIKDPAIQGMDKPTLTAYLRDKYLGIDQPLQQQLGQWPADIPMPPQITEAVRRSKQGESLADYITTSLDPRRFETGFHYGDPLRDVLHRGESSIRQQTAAEGLLHGLQDIAKPADQFERGTSKNMLEALKEGGLGSDHNLRNQLTETIAGLYGIAPNDVNNLHIPRSAADHITSYASKFNVPDAAQGLMGVFDDLTGMTKRGWTSPWPGFTTRNIGSGLFQNMLSGDNPLGAVAGSKNAYDLLKTRQFKGASLLPMFKGMNLTDAQAAEKLRVLARAHGVTSGGAHMGHDIAESLTKRLVDELPGAQPFSASSLPGAYLNMIPRSKADFKSFLPEFLGGGKEFSPPIREGQKIAGWGEDVNRLGGFIEKLKQGASVPTAAKQTRAAQVAYDELSNFEKTVMRRAIPFYSWNRKMLPQVVRQLVENPGGPISMLGRVERGMTGDQWLPEYMTNGLAIPMGGEENGTQRYLTRLGLPQEQVFDWLKGGPQGVQKTMMGLLGEMNPLIKAPLEMAVNKQMFSGRNLEDLHPFLPIPRTGEHAVMNSPLGRLETSLRTATDERKDLGTKALNLLTGVKLSDVDMNRQREITTRQLTEDMLRDQPDVRFYQTPYIRKEDLANATPEEILLMREMRTIEQRMKDQAKQRKIAVMP